MRDANPEILAQKLNDIIQHLSSLATEKPTLETLSVKLLATCLACLKNSVLIVDSNGILVFANPSARLLLSIEDTQIGHSFTNPSGRNDFEDASLLHQFSKMVTPTAFNIDTLIPKVTGKLYHANGQHVQVEARSESLVIQTQALGAVIIMDEQDVSESLLHRKIAQLEAIAEISQLALTSLSQEDMFREVVEMVSDTLKTPFCKILEKREAGGLVFRALTGWKSMTLGQEIPEAGDNHASYSLHMSEPVMVYDLEKEERFLPSPIHEEHSIKSGLTVLIKLRNADYGVLEVDSQQKRDFDQEDQLFLQSIANILSDFIERKTA